MKKTLLIIAVFLIASSSAFSQVDFGVGAVLGTKATVDENANAKMNFGLHARAMLELTDEIFFTGGFSFYLPKKFSYPGVETTINYMVLNADVNYYFLDDGDFAFYGLAGINYGFLHTVLKEDGEPNLTASNGHFDFEIGAGVRYDVYFAELKYDGSNNHIQVFIGIYL